MILLNRTLVEPLYQQIYQQIKEAILAGNLVAGEKLLGSRTLAKSLKVSRNTVDRAYAQLVLEGYLSVRQKSGFVVLALPQTFIQQRPILDEKSIEFEEKNPEIRYDLTNSSHTSNLFPKKIWKKYMLEALGDLEQEEKISTLQAFQGEAYLRKQLLRYLKQIRGIHCREEQIVITSGLQQSLDYLCKILPAENQTILMEEPGYPKARVVFENNHFEIVTSAVDEQGLTFANQQNLKKLGLIYTTPSHQFPTGITMSIARRKALLLYAQQKNALIIEDDYDSELRYYEQLVPSLQSIDYENRVIYLGTFSKALSPSLRIGYMILPEKLLARFKEKFHLMNSTVNLLNQYTVAKILETGEYTRIVRRMNQVFKKRFDCFSKAFAQFDKQHRVKISKNVSGQYFLIEFQKKMNQEQLIEQALKYGIKVYSTMEFWQDKAKCPENTLFLGFSKIKTEEVADCVARLKKAWLPYL